MLNKERSIKKGRVFKCQKLSPKIASLLTALYGSGMPAREAADFVTDTLAKVNKETVRQWWERFRSEVNAIGHKDDAPFTGEVEADEVYLGPKRVKGKRGRGASGKTIVFGLVERATGRTRHFIVKDASSESLIPLIVANVAPGSIIHTDTLAAYRRLKWLGYDHRVVNHKRGEYATPGGRGTNHKEAGWKNLRRMWAKFNGGWKHGTPIWLGEVAVRLEHGRRIFTRWMTELFAPCPG